MHARRLRISGKVQGVYYRASTQARARALGLVGWVRNLRDGRVELVAQGDDEALEALERWCHEGPPRARVDDIEAADHPTDSNLRDFAIAATASV